MDLSFPALLSAERRAILSDAAQRMDSQYGDDFLGLVLSGSAGRGLDTDRSDLDLLVILTPEAATGQRAPSVRTTALDLIPLALEHLETVAGFDDPQYGYRWSYAWAPTLLDRTGGRIAQAVERQTRLDRDESLAILLQHSRLDGWINLAYRALKSARDGNAFEAGLDGSESIPLFLDVVFALEGQVRPYNKYLPWVLRNHPLTGWPAETLLSLLPRFGAGDPAALRSAFGHLRECCSQFGDGSDKVTLQAVFDGWPPAKYPVLWG